MRTHGAYPVWGPSGPALFGQTGCADAAHQGGCNDADRLDPARGADNAVHDGRGRPGGRTCRTGRRAVRQVFGVRGIRFNLAQAGATTPEMMEPLSRRINDLGWHIQINAPAAKILEIMPILERVPSLIVFDHLAHIPQPEGVNHPLYAKVRALMDRGRTWVKLSGAYADTKVGPPTYADSSAVARAYAKAAPERCVWGSDWPHPSEQAKQQLPDDGVLFDLLSDWVPDEKVRHRILVENPATLYDFPKGG